jgi:catechol 2,3-dioxygenase-like lactoylglutathione lyase family enzyme
MGSRDYAPDSPVKERVAMRFKVQIRLIGVWLTLVLASAPLGHAQGEATARRIPVIRAVGGISTTVAEMNRSLDFYAKVLSFEKTSDQEIDVSARARLVIMRLGDESIQLVQFRGKQGQAVPADSRSNDLWFQHIAVIVSDMDRAYAILRANKVEAVSESPQRLPDWNKNAAGIRAFYFKDPDGHPLEILQFPPGKGDPKWQHSSGKVFLGIDHTAIVVSSTDASLKFYHDLLGMQVAGQSENYGPEQERLNHVDGAHLRITSLRVERGLGIELLEYLSPRNGRKLRYEPQISDLVHRHTWLVAADPATLTKTLPATLAPSQYPMERNTFAVRDPDGHELVIRAAQTTKTMGELK